MAEEKIKKKDDGYSMRDIIIGIIMLLAMFIGIILFARWVILTS